MGVCKIFFRCLRFVEKQPNMQMPMNGSSTHLHFTYTRYLTKTVSDIEIFDDYLDELDYLSEAFEQLVDEVPQITDDALERILTKAGV